MKKQKYAKEASFLGANPGNHLNVNYKTKRMVHDEIEKLIETQLGKEAPKPLGLPTVQFRVH